MWSEALRLRYNTVDSDQGAARARRVLLLSVGPWALNNHAISASSLSAGGTDLAAILGAVHDFRAEGTVRHCVAAGIAA